MQSLSIPHVSGISGSEPNSMLVSEPSVINTTVASGNTGTGISGSEPNSMLGSEQSVLITTVASGNTASERNSILGSEHTMLPLGTMPVMSPTTTSLECLFPLDSTTTTTSSEPDLPLTTTPVECATVTEPSFELVSEPIEVNHSLVNNGSEKNSLPPFNMCTR